MQRHHVQEVPSALQLSDEVYGIVWLPGMVLSGRRHVRPRLLPHGFSHMQPYWMHLLPPRLLVRRLAVQLLLVRLHRGPPLERGCHANEWIVSHEAPVLHVDDGSVGLRSPV